MDYGATRGELGEMKQGISDQLPEDQAAFLEQPVSLQDRNWTHDE